MVQIIKIIATKENIKITYRDENGNIYRTKITSRSNTVPQIENILLDKNKWPAP